MWLHADTITDYPKVADLLKTLAVSLAKNKVVYDAFLKACAEDAPNPAAAKKLATDKALKWGTGPQVLYADLASVPVGNGEMGPACGYTSSFDKALSKNGKTKILITKIWFDGVQSGSNADLAKNQRRLTTTFLHEAVHWVREEAKAPDEIHVSYKEPPREAGHYFEELAFGKSNICTREEVQDAIMSRRL